MNIDEKQLRECIINASMRMEKIVNAMIEDKRRPAYSDQVFLLHGQLSSIAGLLAPTTSNQDDAKK